MLIKDKSLEESAVNIKKIEKNSQYNFNSIEDQFNFLKKEFHVIAGPCSVENEKLLDITAKELSKLGVKFLRGGLYKPRTSPYEFQGLKENGLKLLKNTAQKYGMLSVSEVTDTRLVESMSEYVDILQIGSRNMQNFELLKEVGRSKKSVLLKRGMSSTIEEFKYAAEYIACEGNNNIIMCERGIRTFETATRNTLDISCAAILKNDTKIPVIIDVSHSLGRKDILKNISRAAVAVGADGIMIEVHCNPSKALSDSFQQLNLNEFEHIFKDIKFFESLLHKL